MDVLKTKCYKLLMTQEKPRFYKGLRGFTRSDDRLLANDADSSVYRWWWEYLRLSPAFWFARETGHALVDAEMAKTYELAGNLKTNNFRRWWEETGVNIFAEAKRPAKTKILNLETLNEHPFKEKALYLEVPLTIRKETIVRQIRKILNEVHEGRELDVTAAANAPFKLHTKRYRLRVIELEYWVLLYRLLYEDIEVWRIGDRLQLAPHLMLRTAERRLESRDKRFNQLNSLTGRYLYKARFTLAHVERKSFPNGSKIIIPEGFMPFGKKYHQDYLAAIGKIDGVQSSWKEWLHQEYATSLKYEVARRNHITEKMKLPGSKIRQRLPDFILGKSDLLD